MHETLLLTGADVAELLSLDDCIAAVEEAFRAHGEERLGAPGIVSAHEHDGAFHIKTAALQLGPRRYFGAKANANFPGNPARNALPSIQGVMLLFDAHDGRPLAIMDSIELTILRTGAATAVAAKHLARRDARSVAIVGCGRQGRVQLDALRRVLPIERVTVFDANRDVAEAFGEEVADDLESMRDADVWITCTPAKRAFLGTRHVKRGAFVAAVGADNPEKSEIKPELMRGALVVADVTAQCATIGDLRVAIAAGVMTREQVYAELGEVVAGTKRGRESGDEIVLFDSTGAGFQDTAAAAIVYERALERNRGTRVKLPR
ncbi:MAG TPA: ornithine cyclodeaminase family protein [Thermoanaerobaculia bacterium]|jgi:ornithine cyclodeaminase/alanine dehydrogenase-like protein (mu-crystallin family)